LSPHYTAFHTGYLAVLVRRHLITVIIIINTIADVIILAINTDREWIKRPYNIHKKLPVNCKESMPKDKPLTCFVIIVLIACGKKAVVVSIAAEYPNISGEKTILTLP